MMLIGLQEWIMMIMMIMTMMMMMMKNMYMKKKRMMMRMMMNLMKMKKLTQQKLMILWQKAEMSPIQSSINNLRQMKTYSNLSNKMMQLSSVENLRWMR